MTAQRDESRDIQISAESLSLTRENSTYPFHGEFLPYVSGAPSDLVHWVRFVEHSQYAALETENASLAQSLAEALEKIAALEKERDELRERLEQYEAEQLARVCPGCHAVAPERCAPGCIDAEMAREREDDLTFGNYEKVDDDTDEGDW